MFCFGLHAIVMVRPGKVSVVIEILMEYGPVAYYCYLKYMSHYKVHASDLSLLVRGCSGKNV